MSYFFLALENLSVPFLYHPWEFCLGAGSVYSKPADVIAPESEQLLVPLPSGLQIAHSLVLNNLPEPGSLDKYQWVSLSHSQPAPSRTHTQPTPAEGMAHGTVSQLRPPGDGLLGAQHSQARSNPHLNSGPRGPHLHDCHAVPTTAGWRARWQCHWAPWRPWWLPGPGGGLQKADLALVKARGRARLRPVGLNDVLDGPPADGAAGPGLPLEPQATAVAQTHVSACVDDRVHLAVEAHGALAALAAHQLRRGGHGRHWWAQRGAGCRHCREGEQADLNSRFPGGLCWATPRGQSFCARTHGGQLWETRSSVLFLGFAPFPTLLPPSSKHGCHPLECHIQMFLLPPGKDAGVGARSAHLPAPPRVHTSLPRDDSDAEEDWLTLKAMSESLSSWEPLRDPDGDVVAGLDCRVPETKENPSGTWEVGSALLAPGSLLLCTFTSSWI